MFVEKDKSDKRIRKEKSMLNTNQLAKKIKIAYIGGGSRGWAWTFMTDLALEPRLCGTISLYDINEEAAQKNAVIGNKVSAREEAVGKWHYEVGSSLEESLCGADFIVLSILPGTFEEMAVDVHMPERLSLYQSVGDTAGPGGIIRALRTIPMYEQIAEIWSRVIYRFQIIAADNSEGLLPKNKTAPCMGR